MIKTYNFTLEDDHAMSLTNSKTRRFTITREEILSNRGQDMALTSYNRNSVRGYTSISHADVFQRSTICPSYAKSFRLQDQPFMTARTSSVLGPNGSFFDHAFGSTQATLKDE